MTAGLKVIRMFVVRGGESLLRSLSCLFFANRAIQELIVRAELYTTTESTSSGMEANIESPSNELHSRPRDEFDLRRGFHLGTAQPDDGEPVSPRQDDGEDGSSPDEEQTLLDAIEGDEDLQRELRRLFDIEPYGPN